MENGNSRIKIFTSVIIILLFLFVFLLIFLIKGVSGVEEKNIFTKNKEKSVTAEELAIAYVKDKYDIEVEIFGSEDTYDVYMEETSNKEKIFDVDTGEEFFHMLMVDNGKETQFFDDYEEELFALKLEQYFKEKIGVECNVFLVAGERPEENLNFFGKEERPENIIEIFNKNNFYVVVEVEKGIDIKQFTVNDFLELFPAESLNNRNVNKKIILCSLKENNDADHVYLSDNYRIIDNDENEWERHIKKYNYLYSDIKIISNYIEKEYSKAIEENGIINYFSGEITNIKIEDNASIKDLPNYKKKFKDLEQVSGKYIMDTNVPEYDPLYVAIKLVDMGIVDEDQIYDYDIIEKKDDGTYSRVYGLPYGEYMLFDFYPYKNKVEFFIIKE